MTISSSDNKVNYVGNDVIVEFSYTFRVDDESWMQVYLDDVLQSTGYSVDLVTKKVTFVTAPATDVTVTLYRYVPLTQEADYVPYDAFPAETHELALDKLTMQTQQNNEAIGRAISAPPSDDGSVDYTLPAAESLKLMRWNDAADALENINVEDLGEFTAISDFGKTLIDDADALEARGTLEAPKVAAAPVASNMVQHDADGDLADTGYPVTQAVLLSTTHDMTSDADYDLTASQNNYSRVNIKDTGALLSVERTIGISGSERGFTARNSTAKSLLFAPTVGGGDTVQILPYDEVSLYYDGSDVFVIGIPQFKQLIEVTATGAYTPSAGARYGDVFTTGTGGAGGGGNQNATDDGVGSGGGGGGTAIKRKVPFPSGYSSSVTIGAVPVGTINAGTAGGDTTYADGTLTLTGGGGPGGLANAGATRTQASGVLGGVAAGRDENISGDGSGYSFMADNVKGGSKGGGSYWGSPANSIVGTGSTAGVPGITYGEAGGGAIANNGGTDEVGGDGSAGVVKVYEYY